MGQIRFPVLRDRTQVRDTALGYVSRTSSLEAISSGTTTLAAQALRGTALGLRQGDVVTNIVVCVTTAAGGTAGSVNVGLYSSAYGKLVGSGEVQSSLTATGVVALALSSPYTSTVDDVFYPVILMITAYGSTQPALASGVTTNVSVALSGKPKSAWLQSSQSSLPSTATPADTSAALWFGVS